MTATVSPQPTQLTIPQARAQLAPTEFRRVLRRTMLDHPDIKLKHVANALGVTRQRVALMVGPLGRPDCVHQVRLAPKREKAAASLEELTRRVAAGEPASKVAGQIGISMTVAAKLGFRVRQIRPSHGTQVRSDAGCNCWRCRRAAGIFLSRGRRMNQAIKTDILDWLAWHDPDTGEHLTQAMIGRLSGAAQPTVSRIVRSLV